MGIKILLIEYSQILFGSLFLRESSIGGLIPYVCPMNMNYRQGHFSILISIKAVLDEIVMGMFLAILWIKTILETFVKTSFSTR